MNNCVTDIVELAFPDVFCNVQTLSSTQVTYVPSSLHLPGGTGTKRKPASGSYKLGPSHDSCTPQSFRTPPHSILPFSSFQISLGADNISLCTAAVLPFLGSAILLNLNTVSRARKLNICHAHFKM